MYRLIIVTAIWSSSTVNLLAQETQTPVLNSNRIGFTESSRTVMKGGFLLEAGFAFGHSRNNLYSGDRYIKNFIRTPKLRLSYGITNFMEIQVEGNYSKSSFQSGSELVNSEENAKYSLGLKFNLFKQKGLLPQTAFSITEKYYVGSKFPSFLKTTANLAWSYKLGKHFNLSGNILYSHSDGGYNGLGLGIRFGYNFNDKFGLYTEWYIFDNFTDFSVFNVGAWYKVTPRFLVSLNVGTNMVTKYDWANKNSNYNVTLGASFLLNNPNKKLKKRN